MTMPAPPPASPSPAAPVKRKGGGMIVTGIILLVLGIVGFVGGLVMAASQSGLGDTLTSPQEQVPGSITRSLSPGTYVVFEQVGSRGVANLDPTITPADVTVAGPDGSTVTVGSPTGVETVTRGNAVYTGVAAFEVRTAGTYTVDISAPAPTTVIVAPGLLGGFTSAVGGIALAIGAVLLGLVGLVLLIVGVVRRVRSGRPAAVAPAYGGYGVAPAPGYGAPPGGGYGLPPGAPAGAAPAVPPGAPAAMPAGWYPDAERPGGQRYWDGAAWTEHRA